MEKTIDQISGSFPSEFEALLNSPLKFRLFLLKQLPAAYFSGVHLQSVNTERCEVGIRYKWLTRNPFRSTYFACLSMAAEMSTGILAMGNVYGRKPGVSLLVTAVEGNFFKKATGRTTFRCEEGGAIRQAVEDAVRLGQPQTVRVLSSGYSEEGERVAEFFVTWSFRQKTL
ncbi:MAG TPA: DUF4442 domain-containing protein [Flavisolibacter sp.]|nr:DUF4442 domain-containing protein [Flavisolibacter sp.]